MQNGYTQFDDIDRRHGFHILAHTINSFATDAFGRIIISLPRSSTRADIDRVH